MMHVLLLHVLLLHVLLARAHPDGRADAEAGVNAAHVVQQLGARDAHRDRQPVRQDEDDKPAHASSTIQL